MDSPRVSIIIPVYNAEEYLPECIQTLRGQTLQNLELIFINDASPDGCGSILQAAEQEDSRIRVITFPENRGVSAARNAGIEAARGAFIGFCDSDDWVEPEMYGALFEACIETGSDLSFCRVYKDWDQKSQNVPLGFENGTLFDADSIRHRLIPAMLALPKDGDGQPLSGYTPRNLFRREILSGVRFREDIRYAEDLLFIVTALLQSGRACAVDAAYYHYRFYAGSVTKHYSPYVPESFEQSNAAIARLTEEIPECRERMEIRCRKMAVDAVRNICTIGTPFAFLDRLRWVRQYMKRPDIRALYRGLRLTSLPKRTALRLGLMKYRMALISVLLYSGPFRRQT